MALVTFDNLLRRFQKRIESLDPKSTRMREALTQIGTLITNEAKINAARVGVVDRGSLRSAINFSLVEEGRQTGLIVSPFGTRYAAIHEYGGPFTKLMRKAMFASLRDAGKLNRVPTRKNVVVGGSIRARPFLGPALKTNAERILEAFQKAISNSMSQT